MSFCLPVRRIKAGMIRSMVAGTVLLGTLSTSVAAEPIEIIPANASAVVRLKNPEQTIAKVGNFANAIQPGLGFMVQGNAPAMGVVISNPTLGGVDLKRDWYAVIFAVRDAEPSVAFIVPATDVDAMKEAIGEGFESVATDDKWVAYSEDVAVIELIEDTIAGEEDAISDTIDERSQQLFNDSDLSVYVNAIALTATYEAELAEADSQIDGLMEAISLQAPDTPGVNLAAIMDVYGDVLHGLLNAVRDSEALTIGIEVADDALNIQELLIVEADTGTDAFLKANKTSSMSLLTKLPANQAGYMAIHGDARGLINWGMQFAASIVQDNDKADEMIQKVKEATEGIDFGTIAWGFNLTDRSEGALEAVTVSEVKPSGKMREFARQVNDFYKFELPGVTQEIDVQADAETYGDLKADVITLRQEFSDEADPLGIQNQMQKVLHGPDGMVQRLTNRGDYVIQTVGGGQENMKAALAALDAAPASTPDEARKTRDRLLENANLVVMVDVPNLVANVLRMVARMEVLPIPIKADQLKALKLRPSYIGFSMGTEEQALRMKTAIPASSLQRFVEIGMFIQTMQQGGGAGGF